MLSAKVLSSKSKRLVLNVMDKPVPERHVGANPSCMNFFEMAEKSVARARSENCPQKTTRV